MPSIRPICLSTWLENEKTQYFSSASPYYPEMTEDCKLEVQKDR